MNSDMSKRTSDFSEPNKNSAKRLATSVFPTPVGPRKKKQPTGRKGDLRPARLRRMARARAVMALSWLMTRLAEFLFGSEKSLVRFDMSEFMEKRSEERRVGKEWRAGW